MSIRKRTKEVKECITAALEYNGFYDEVSIRPINDRKIK